MRHLV